MRHIFSLLLAFIGAVAVASDAQAVPIQIYNSVTGVYAGTSPDTLSGGVLAGQIASENLLGVAYNGTHLGAYRTATNGLVQYNLLTGMQVGSPSTAILGAGGSPTLTGDPVGAPSGGDFLGYMNNTIAAFAAYNVGGATFVYNAFTGANTAGFASTLSGGPLAGDSAGEPAGGDFLGYGHNSATNFYAYNAGGTIQIYNGFGEPGAYIGAHAALLSGGPLAGLSAGDPDGFEVVGWGIQSGVAFVYYAQVITPEPSTFALAMVGLLGLASRSVVRRRKRK